MVKDGLGCVALGLRSFRFRGAFFGYGFEDVDI